MKDVVEFFEDGHIYLVNGVIVPSVSTILGATLFKGKYDSVPPFVLQRAAQFGTGVHEAIENGEWLGLDDVQYKVYQNYLKLLKTEDITPTAHERIVNYGYDYAGTYDMDCMIKGADCLADVKTTYALDIEYLSWQLSMYELASGKRYEKLYAIWLPKRKGAELVEIARKSKEEIQWLIKKYKEIKNEQTN